MTGEPAHAPLAPSGAHIWAAPGGCRGYVAYAAAYPEPEDSEEAREGTAAHFYPTELLQGRDVAVGAVAPNGVPISAEMVDAAQGLLADVRDTLAAATPGSELWVERRVHMPIVHEANWGTLDVTVIDRARKVVHLWDYKYGHRFVPAPGNLQLIDYGIGVLRELAPCADWPSWTITMTVAQPRNYHPDGPIREWRLDGGRLLDEYVPQFFEAAREAMTPGAPVTSGEHCRDCSARHVCPALQSAVAIACDVSLQSLPVHLPPHAVGLELRFIQDAIRRLEARATGLEAQALGMIRGGTGVPFFSAEHASGREKWTVLADEVFALGDVLGADLRKAPEPITPGQARWALTKLGIDASVIAAYAEKPRGALRLVRVDDSAAKLAFE